MSLTTTTVRFDAAARGRIRQEAAGAALAREQEHVLPTAEVTELLIAGFGALRLGDDQTPAISLVDFFDELIGLAAADSNIAHLFRGHIAFVELVLLESGTDRSEIWRERIRAGDLFGNAQSERGDTAALTATLTEVGEGSAQRILLNGAKFYTTGSIYSDWILLSALEGEERVSVIVPARAPGVVITDDWDGFGQQLTGSGSTVFTNVEVDPENIRRYDGVDGPSRLLTALFQLVLLATAAGVAEAALQDAVTFVRSRRRIFGFEGETLARENEAVQGVIGSLSAAASAARAIVLQAVRELETVLDAWRAGQASEEDTIAVELTAFRAQAAVLPLVLDATTRLFEVGGASAVGTGLGLDRHWRNARTIASHNPAIHRLRAIGDWELNAVAPTWRKQSAEAAAAPDTTAPAAAAPDTRTTGE